MKYKGLWMAVLSGVLLLSTVVAQAGENAHFAAFFNNGSKANIAYPATVSGKHIEKSMAKLGASMMVYSFSAGIKNGDVWSLQNNTLRDVNGKFQDAGVGCELMLQAKPVRVGGMCSVFMAHDKGKAQTKFLLQAVPVKKALVWVKIFDDKPHGVAGYVMRESVAGAHH